MDLADFSWLWQNEELSDFTLIIKPVARRHAGVELEFAGAAGAGEGDEDPEETAAAATDSDHASGSGAGAVRSSATARPTRGGARKHAARGASAAASSGGGSGVVTRRGAAEHRGGGGGGGASSAAPRAGNEAEHGHDAAGEGAQQHEQPRGGRRARGSHAPQPELSDGARGGGDGGGADSGAAAGADAAAAGNAKVLPAGRRALRVRRRGAAGDGAAEPAMCAGPGGGGGTQRPASAPCAGRITRGAERRESHKPSHQQQPQQHHQQHHHHKQPADAPAAPAPPTRRARRGEANGSAAAAAAGVGPGSLAAAAAEGLRRIPVHAAVLSGMSPYFRALVRNWSGGLVDRTITLEVGEDEGYAAELMLEFMYTGRLPLDAPPTELLRMIRLADQYQVQRFLSACNASFDGLALDRLDLSVALSVFSLPPLMLESDALARVVRKVEAKVQAVFGDLEAVWAGDAAREEFLRLPFRAVRALLASEDTAVHNENTVVVALAGWLELGAGRRATAEQRRQLAELVRLPFLTSSFIGDIIHTLPWMRDSLDARTLLAAFQFAVSSEATRARLVAEFASHPSAPPGMRFYRVPRPSSAATKLVFDWAVDLAHIKRMVADARLWNRVVEAQSPLHYFGGFHWQLLFNVERAAPPSPDSPAAGGGGGVGALAGAVAEEDAADGGAAENGNGAGGENVRGEAAGGGGGGGGGAPAAVVEFVGVRCSATLAGAEVWPRVVRFKAQISALTTGFWDLEYVHSKALEGVIQDGVGLGYPGYFALPSGHLDSDAAWSRFVRGGRVHLRCEIQECE